jgi:hypothetical protein
METIIKKRANYMASIIILILIIFLLPFPDAFSKHHHANQGSGGDGGTSSNDQTGKGSGGDGGTSSNDQTGKGSGGDGGNLKTTGRATAVPPSLSVPPLSVPPLSVPPQGYTPPSDTNTQGSSDTNTQGELSFNPNNGAEAISPPTPAFHRNTVINRVLFIIPHQNTNSFFHVPSSASNAKLTGTFRVTGGLSFQNIVEMYVVDSIACPSSVPNPFTCSQYVIKEDKPFDDSINISLEPGETYYLGFDNPASSTSEVQANFVLEYQ